MQRSINVSTFDGYMLKRFNWRKSKRLFRRYNHKNKKLERTYNHVNTRNLEIVGGRIGRKRGKM
jgi:hypothetical protein